MRAATLTFNTDACFDTCVSQGSSRPVLGRVIRRADIVATFTHTVSLCGNRRSMLRCDARDVARRVDFLRKKTDFVGTYGLLYSVQ